MNAGAATVAEEDESEIAIETDSVIGAGSL